MGVVGHKNQAQVSGSEMKECLKGFYQFLHFQNKNKISVSSQPPTTQVLRSTEDG